MNDDPEAVRSGLGTHDGPASSDVEAATHGESLLGDILTKGGHVSDAQIQEALAEHQRSGEYLGQCLVKLRYATEEHVLGALGLQLGLAVVDPTTMDLDGTASLIKGDLARKHRIIPIEATPGAVTIAMTDPFDFRAVDDVALATGRKVVRALAGQESILEAIEKAYGITVERVIRRLAEPDEEQDAAAPADVHDLEEMADEPTVVHLVDLLINQAIQDRASDIHIEPFEKKLKVKYRIDGVLHDMSPPPKHLHAAIVSRIKVMADMNIAERFIPQDGHIELNLADTLVDIRVSTVPTIFGEGVVLRLLNKSSMLLGLDELGASEAILERFQHVLALAHGLCLVVGPTGCGKTTTLYGALREIYTEEKKIITIEDPVEYQLDGITQIPVRPKRGITFANGLRAILRHDPDIVLVGEIRDTETADMAIRSSLTGHLVFSTLHTNDAPGAVTRLLDMGVEPYLASSSLAAVLGQRLVRTVCEKCKTELPLDEPVRAQIDSELGEMVAKTHCKGVGCKACKGTGYRGRTGIFELLTVNEVIQSLIMQHGTADTIRGAARGTMESLRCDGWRKVCAGITTPDEVLRVTQEIE